MEKGMTMLGLRVALVLLVTVASLNRAVARDENVGAAFTDAFGYSRCIRLENENTKVILCPEAGGRVLEYSWNGKNCLYVDSTQNGWHYEPGKRAIDACGGRFDVGPEHVIPRHPDLWLGKWTGELIGPRAARLTSVQDKATGVQLMREFALDGSSSRLTCTQTIKNISDHAIPWCHWSRTLVEGGGICVVPLTSPSRFPKSYIMYGPGTVMNFEPKDPNIRAREGFLEVLATPKEPKLGIDSYAGWLCYFTKHDLLFVKRFPTYPERVYNEMAAITISIWYYKDSMCELEPIGPRTNLAPNQSVAFAEQWWLLPQKFPEHGKDLDLQQVSQKVDALFATAPAP
jgi:hypothetical protein